MAYLFIVAVALYFIGQKTDKLETFFKYLSYAVTVVTFVGLGIGFDDSDNDEMDGYQNDSDSEVIDFSFNRSNLEKGDQEFKLKNYTQAVNYYKKAISDGKDLSYVYLKIGESYVELDLKNIALDYFDEALKLDPANYKTYNEIGDIYAKSKNYEEALKHYETGISYNPNYPSLWNSKASSLMNTDRIEEAVHCYEKALSLDPEYPNAWLGLGIIHYYGCDCDMALKYLDKAVKYSKGWQKPVEAQKKISMDCKMNTLCAWGRQAYVEYINRTK